ncbi:MAG: hypothetical protein AB7H80_06420 [Candidatus Kapaibacterium sp.]
MLDRQLPENIRQRSVDVEAYRLKYEGEDGVYFYREYVVEVQLKQDYLGGGSGPWIHEIGAIRYLVLNPDEEWLGTFDLQVEKGKSLESAFITIISPTGEVKQFDKDDLRVELDSKGNKRYQLVYPGIVVGSIVDEGYDIAYNGLELNELFHEVRLQYSIPCERLSVRYIAHTIWNIEFRGWNNALGTYRKIVDDDERLTIASFEAENLPAYKPEPYAPYYREQVGHLEAMITNYYYGARKWDKLAESAYELFIQEETPRNSTLSKLADEIVDRNASEKAKVEKIMNWMYSEFNVKTSEQRRSRVVHIHDAIQKREGSVPLSVALTYHLLKEVGLEPSFLLVHSINDIPYTEGFVYPPTFQVMALRVKANDTNYFLFPYVKNYPINHIPFVFEGQPVLRVVNGGFIGVDTIPVNLGSNTRIESDFDIELNEDGVLNISETRYLHGDAGFGLRREIEDATDEELEKKMKELIVYETGEYTFNSYRLENQGDYNKPLIIHLEYSVDNLVTITPEEVILQTEGLFTPSLTGKTKVDAEKRKNPIKIYSNEEFLKKITLHVPTSWQVQNLPENREEKTSLGEVLATYSHTPGQLSVEYRRLLKRAERPASDYSELLTLIGTHSRLTLPTLIFSVE